MTPTPRARTTGQDTTAQHAAEVAPRWRRLVAMPLQELQAAARNPKAHDLTSISGAIGHFGYVDVIVVDDRTGRLVAGHGRVEALARQKQQGGAAPEGVDVRDSDGEWLVPALRGWASRSDEDAEAYLVASNRLSELGGWDQQGLADVLSDLADGQLLDVTGYTPDDLHAILDSLNIDPPTGSGPGADPDDDDVDPPADPVSRAGDVWQLGPHRLVVGDARYRATWDALVGDQRVDAVWTDPPYGVSYVGKTSTAMTIDNDELTGAALEQFLQAALTATFMRTRGGATWYVAAPSGPQSLQFSKVLASLGVFRQLLVWVKDQFVMGHSDYHYRHELIFYGWTPGGRHTSPPDRRQDSVHEVPRPRRNADHPTSKPVELIERHLTNSAQRGSVVADPFGGSGSTLIACHRLDMVGRLVELDPRYADVICRRYQQHAGVLPVRGGETHDFLTETPEEDP